MTDPGVVDEVVRLVLARLVEALGAAAKPVYSSRRGHGPPGYAHRRWQEIAREIGTRRGRWWIVTAEQLAAHEGRQAHPPSNVVSGPWSPAQALRQAGLRGSR